MKTIGSALTLTLLTTAAVAQQPAAPATKTYTSSAEITALIAKAKSERKENQALVAQPILHLAPYNNASLEYRASVGPAAVHEKEAEYFYVVDGSATLVTGGKLVGETRNGDNLTGTAIEGGSPRNVAKGDFIVVPENTPHWFSPINGTIVLMSLHVAKPAK